MGQSFREQLAQSSALAQRVITKIRGRKDNVHISPTPLSSSFAKAALILLFYIYFCFIATGEHAESHDDKTGHELLALRFVSLIIIAHCRKAKADNNVFACS